MVKIPGRFAGISMVAILGFCSADQASNFSHCELNENTAFSCTLENGNTASLCHVSGATSRSMFFRLGAYPNVTFSYPAATETTTTPDFFWNHYFRAQVDYFEISFTDEESEYRIFRHYDAALNEQPHFGVSVQDTYATVPETIFACTANVVDHLLPLSATLPCGRESALGCAK